MKKHLWITDPWNTLDHPFDTTLRWIEEAQKMGVTQYWCDVKTIRLESQVLLAAQKIISVQQARASDSFELGPIEIFSPSQFSTLHYRTDPPVDLAYLHPLHLLNLELQGSKKSTLVNPIEVLLSQNEKIEASCLGDLMPASIVSSQWFDLLAFGKKYQRTVLKPLHEAQSHGIELLDWRTTDGIERAQNKLVIATQKFNTPVILQIYLEGIAEGETRLWFLDGKLLAHVKKLPVTGDFRVNIDLGSQLAPSVLNAFEKKAVTRIAKHLRARKIRLSAVDLIENYITDFNFTSPGLISQMEMLLQKNLAAPIVKALFSK